MKDFKTISDLEVNGSDQFKKLVEEEVEYPESLTLFISGPDTTVKYVSKDICDDLLEALELMVSTHEEGGWPTATITIARAAIAKARGIENE